MLDTVPSVGQEATTPEQIRPVTALPVPQHEVNRYAPHSPEAQSERAQRAHRVEGVHEEG